MAYLRFAPYVAIALLLAALLWLRGDLTRVRSERDANAVQMELHKAANEHNVRVIQGFARRQVDNDAIAEAIAARLAGNTQRTEQSRQRIREASNDPVVRNWADQPIPRSVQDALGPDRVQNSSR